MTRFSAVWLLKQCLISWAGWCAGATGIGLSRRGGVLFEFGTPWEPRGDSLREISQRAPERARSHRAFKSP